MECEGSSQDLGNKMTLEDCALACYSHSTVFKYGSKGTFEPDQGYHCECELEGNSNGCDKMVRKAQYVLYHYKKNGRKIIFLVPNRREDWSGSICVQFAPNHQQTLLGVRFTMEKPIDIFLGGTST